nr:hypothetical protein [uncultured Kingella sp.]
MRYKPIEEKNDNAGNQPNIVRILKHGQTAPIHHKTPKKPTQRNLLHPSKKTTKAKKQNRLDFVDLHFQAADVLRQPENAETVRRRHAGCIVPKTQQGNCAGGLSADYRPRIRDTPRLKRYVRLPPVHGRKRATRMHGIVFRQAGCCLQPLIRLHRSGFASDGCCVRQVVKERVLLNLV